MNMQIKPYVLVFIALILFIFSYGTYNWSKDFIDPCCSGRCGRCPPSFWECDFMGMISMYQIIIGVVLIFIGFWDYTEQKPCNKE